MERKYQIGQHIIFVDPKGNRRDAVVTAWWTSVANSYSFHDPEHPMPGVNIVIVSDDERENDSYGRQIERHTSVVHKTQQPAPGNYWCWPDE